MSKLLNRPLRAFAWYALLLLACSIPVYYVVVDRIWLTELDEHNHIIKQRIENKLQTADISEDELEKVIALWKVLEPGTTLEQVSDMVQKKDSIYTVTRTTDFGGEVETDRFRGLQSYITVNGHSYRLRTETNVEEADETLAVIAAVTALFFGLLLFGFILLNRRISKRVWKPFYDTLDQLRKFELDKSPEVVLTATDIEEFDRLNRELERLILHSVSTYNQQKEFIENASHELQTPLAVLRSKLELFLQNENLTEQQSDLISSIEAPLARVSRINKNLLVLAKIGNQQFADTEAIDLNLLINESLEMLSDYMVDKDIQLERVLTESININCNRPLFEMLVNNLLVNAIMHNMEHGALIVKTYENGMMVSNSGTDPLHPDGLFKRFTTTSSNTQNSGLGLAIVKEICDRYGWSVSYRFEHGMHIFSVDF